MKKVKTNVMRLLDKAKVPYDAMYYDIDKEGFDGKKVTDLLGLKYEECFKTLALKHDHDLYVIVIPVDKELDLKKAAKNIGVKELVMVHVKDLLKTVGYERGSVSPVGIRVKHEVIFDSSVDRLDKIEISGGQMGVGLNCDKDSLLKYLNAKVLDVCKGEK